MNDFTFHRSSFALKAFVSIHSSRSPSRFSARWTDWSFVLESRYSSSLYRSAIFIFALISFCSSLSALYLVPRVLFLDCGCSLFYIVHIILLYNGLIWLLYAWMLFLFCSFVLWAESSLISDNSLLTGSSVCLYLSFAFFEIALCFLICFVTILCGFRFRNNFKFLVVFVLLYYMLFYSNFYSTGRVIVDYAVSMIEKLWGL